MDDLFGCFVGRPVLQARRPGAMLVAVMDHMDMAGLPTGAGLGLAGLVPAKDAEVVGRLREAGPLFLGKTRRDEVALGASGDNPHHGRTGNLRAPDRSPGASSGGSAAAVAAGHCDAALGTDTLRSIRIPAAYCGVVGFNPGRSVLSTHGIVPLSSTLDTVGILAATVDATLLACDLLMLPTTATPAFAWINGPPLGQADLTALANAGGHPAINVPAAGAP